MTTDPQEIADEYAHKAIKNPDQSLNYWFLQALTAATEPLRKELEEVKKICGDRYPDARALETIHTLRTQLTSLQQQLTQAQTWLKESELKYDTEYHDRLALQQQNERLVAAYVKIMEWAIVPIESLQDLGTPGKVVGFRCVLCNHDCELGQELIHDSGCPIPLQFLTPPTTPAGNEK
jgi:hypothetical protein